MKFKKTQTFNNSVYFMGSGRDVEKRIITELEKLSDDGRFSQAWDEIRPNANESKFSRRNVLGMSAGALLGGAAAYIPSEVTSIDEYVREHIVDIDPKILTVASAALGALAGKALAENTSEREDLEHLMNYSISTL